MKASQRTNRQLALCLLTALLAALIGMFSLYRCQSRHWQQREAKNLAQNALSSFAEFQSSGDEGAFRQGTDTFKAFYTAADELPDAPSALRQTCKRVHAYLLYQPERAKEHMEPLMEGLEILAGNPASMDAYADLNAFLQAVHVPGTEG